MDNKRDWDSPIYLSLIPQKRLGATLHPTFFLVLSEATATTNQTKQTTYKTCHVILAKQTTYKTCHVILA